MGNTAFTRIAFVYGAHACRGVGALGIAAKSVAAIWPVIKAASALRVWAIHATVIVVIAGRLSHEAFKRAMIAIGELHCITPLLIIRVNKLHIRIDYICPLPTAPSCCEAALNHGSAVPVFVACH